MKHVEDGKDDRFFVLTTSKKEKDVENALASNHVLSVPSNEVVDKMEMVYEKTEDTGNEHGFRVGNKGISSIIVPGSETEINKEAWLPAVEDLKAKGDLVSYDVHSHPQGEVKGNNINYGLAKASQTDLNNVVGNQPNIVLGYRVQQEKPTNQYGGKPVVTFVRQIGFFDRKGVIHKPIDFSRFKSAVKKINTK